jgi:hypothetical protein
VCGTTRETSCRGVCCARFLRFSYIYYIVRNATPYPSLVHVGMWGLWGESTTGGREAKGQGGRWRIRAIRREHALLLLLFILYKQRK